MLYMLQRVIHVPINETILLFYIVIIEICFLVRLIISLYVSVNQIFYVYACVMQRVKQNSNTDHLIGL